MSFDSSITSLVSVSLTPFYSFLPPCPGKQKSQQGHKSLSQTRGLLFSVQWINFHFSTQVSKSWLVSDITPNWCSSLMFSPVRKRFCCSRYLSSICLRSDTFIHDAVYFIFSNFALDFISLPSRSLQSALVVHQNLGSEFLPWKRLQVPSGTFLLTTFLLLTVPWKFHRLPDQTAWASWFHFLKEGCLSSCSLAFKNTVRSDASVFFMLTFCSKWFQKRAAHYIYELRCFTSSSFNLVSAFSIIAWNSVARHRFREKKAATYFALVW